MFRKYLLAIETLQEEIEVIVASQGLAIDAKKEIITRKSKEILNIARTLREDKEKKKWLNYSNKTVYGSLCQ